MKNLIYKSSIAIFLVTACLLSSTFVNAQIEAMTITATGTGKTTGDIVAMTIYNPTDKEVKGSLGPYFIPSEGSYQPYITLKSDPVTVPAGKTVYITLKGFCADITKPPASEKDHFRPIDTWVTNDTARMTILPFPLVPNPDTSPKEAVPALLKALEEIGRSYDKLKTEGKIITPFSGNPEKEREAVIQQTFWIYTSELRQKPYTKEQFSTRTYEQFEQKNNINPSTLPKDQKEKIDKGIDDFWNTFQAVGTEAKVLNTPSKPEDEGMIKTISGPVVTPCNCGECRLVEGQRIEIFLEKYGKPFEGDSIPWSIDQIYIDRPEVLSTCIPMECKSTREFEIRTTLTYKDKKHIAPPAVWKVYDFTRISPIMEHQGEMLIEFRFKCYCAGKFCAEGTTSRKVYFIERNDCCDKIRANNNGQLAFSFTGGSAKLSGNTLSVDLPGCDIPPFLFNFNLEAIFCNLTDDQVFSQLISMAQSSLKNGNISEFSSSQSLGLGGVSTDPNMSKFYGFGFSKRVNEKEMSVFISIDKEKCAFDMSIFCDGKLHEFTAPPYLSSSQLQSMTYALNNPGQQQYWVNALMILSHLARADEHNMDKKYQQAFYTILGAISTQASNMATNPQYKSISTQLSELAAAAKQALSSGSFSNIGNVMQKMMPVANFFGK